MPSYSPWCRTRCRTGSPAQVELVQVGSFFVMYAQLFNAETLFLSSGTASATIRATNAPVAVTQSGTTITISSTPATLPSASCPAANGSTYTATNKPLPTFAPELGLQVASTSLLFEILCNTNLAEENGHIIDIQLIPNVSTLNDCLEECALYSFRTKLQHFPANACTAVAWGTYDALQEAGDPWPVCWLKSNATLESANQTNTKGTTSGAVLLGFDS